MHKYSVVPASRRSGGRVQIRAKSRQAPGNLEANARVILGSATRPNVERRPSVILVDDDAASAEMYRVGLEHGGFAASWVADGAGLFEAMSLGVPDIVVLDWQLPGMNGDEILLRIRLDERTRTLPVFMLSNYPAEKAGEIDRVFMAGAVAWLEKVNTPPMLLAEKLKEALAA